MTNAKRHGQFFTPPGVAATLVDWVVRAQADRILDPSCGDGEFLVAHHNAFGCELDAEHAATARKRAPAALVLGCDFFGWADTTGERFSGIAGNPPFIRYQDFSGALRERALKAAERFGAKLPALTSSWAPFVAASARLLQRGGRLAFIVPAEIGHAAYAVPLIEALCASFGEVAIVAVREKIFPALSEDAWVLYADNYGAASDAVRLVCVDRFVEHMPVPRDGRLVPLDALRDVRGRLRRYLLPREVLQAYEELERSAQVLRFGEVASVGIGYVSGANEFFHLRPSFVKKTGIPADFLSPAVRRGASLPQTSTLTESQVQTWVDNDEAVLLLRLRCNANELPLAIRRYLDCAEGRSAREAYKCRVRDPWWSVPDVTIPDGFLTYMSGETVSLVRNAAGCVATNSVHVVKMKKQTSFRALQAAFDSPLSRLSCEIEGHPLGGGMLKLEPREAQRLLLPMPSANKQSKDAGEVLEHGITHMRAWRGYA
jgi:adenine-specific DNA-methyltransferase